MRNDAEALRRGLAELARQYEMGPTLYERTKQQVRARRRRRVVHRVVGTAAAVLLVAGAVAAAVAVQEPEATPVEVLDRPEVPGVWRVITAVPIAPRATAAVTWTGDELFVWGGASPSLEAEPRTDGARYDPEADEWRPVAAPPEPSAASAHAWAEWTGDAVIVWGASGDGAAAYDPAVDRWRALPPSPHDGVVGAAHAWTGEELVVWGGIDRDGAVVATGAVYDAAADGWRPLPPAPVAPRTDATAVWTGSQVVVWGGRSDPGAMTADLVDGAAYDPATQRWRPVPAPPVSAAGTYQLGFGAGAVHLWGVDGPANVFARLDPDTWTWASLPTPPGLVRARLVSVEGDVMLVSPNGRKRGAARWDADAHRWRRYEPPPPAARGAGIVAAAGPAVIVLGDGGGGARYGPQR